MKLCWHLGDNPITWDFAAFLVQAKTLGATSIHFRDTHLSKSKFGGGPDNAAEIALRRYNNILKPLCGLADLPFTTGDDGEPAKSCWHLGDIDRLFKERGSIWKFKAKEDHGQRGYVTVTIRNSFRRLNKNSNRPEWDKVIKEIQKTKPVVVLEDCEREPIDVSKRMSLYQYADMNLGVTGGPMALLHFSESPYLVFKMIPPGDDLWRQHFIRGGFPEGSQLSFRNPRQKIVWGTDNYETIIKEYADSPAVG